MTESGITTREWALRTIVRHAAGFGQDQEERIHAAMRFTHPDRGGSAGEYAAVRRAREILEAQPVGDDTGPPGRITMIYHGHEVEYEYVRADPYCDAVVTCPHCGEDVRTTPRRGPRLRRAREITETDDE